MAGVGREVAPIATWANAGGGHGPRGGRHLCGWATWPPVADASGWRVMRGGRAPRGGRCHVFGDVVSFGWPVG